MYVNRKRKKNNKKNVREECLKNEIVIRNLNNYADSNHHKKDKYMNVL